MTHLTPTAAPKAPPLPLHGKGMGVGGLALALALLLTTQTHAEPAHPARLHLGDHVLMTHDWDYDTDRWLPTAPEVNTACFRVTAVMGTETTLVLVSGRYFTWWDEVEQQPGYQDVWQGTTEFYLEKHPDAAPRELTQGLFTTVAGCAQS
jgi:hypothetical protein